MQMRRTLAMRCFRLALPQPCSADLASNRWAALMKIIFAMSKMPAASFWLLLPLHLAMNLAAIAFFVKKGQGGVILRAQRDALRGLPRMWKKRQYTQQIRRAPIREIWRLLNKTALPTRANRDKI